MLFPRTDLYSPTPSKYLNFFVDNTFLIASRTRSCIYYLLAGLLWSSDVLAPYTHLFDTPFVVMCFHIVFNRLSPLSVLICLFSVFHRPKRQDEEDLLEYLSTRYYLWRLCGSWVSCLFY
ncbi:hypothetical protein C8Q75DRAFT_501662 [Abortiporus biennis]|nr:hypothetical protein C8Q75DRAFT_501662 [Abortiporus biennis]